MKAKPKSKKKPFMITVSFPLPPLPRLNKKQRLQFAVVVENALLELRRVLRR